MVGAGAAADFELRPYGREDEPRVVELLRTCLPAWQLPDAAARLRWKHERSPFGASRCTVAVRGDGRVVGFYASMPWRLVLDGRVLSGRQATDGAVHPDMQRRGIGRAFGGIEHADAERRAQDVHFSHSNFKTEGIKRKFAYPDGAHPPVHLAPWRPGRLARWGVTRQLAPPATPGPGLVPVASILDEDAEAVADLVRRAVPRGRLVTDRSVDYLRWRYADFPGRDYLAAGLRSRGGRLRGLLLGWHVPGVPGEYPDHFEVSETVVPEDDPDALRLLLAVTRRSGATYAAAMLPPDLAEPQRLRSGFVLPRERAWHFSARGLAEGLPDDLSDWRRWELALGDFTTF